MGRLKGADRSGYVFSVELQFVSITFIMRSRVEGDKR